MKKHEIRIDYIEYESIDKLTEEDKNLLVKAKEAAKNAYAPYSGFQVGAAVLLSDGTVITGSNQENAAYPSGLCAERVAAFSAKSSFPDKQITAIAITAFSDEVAVNAPVYPCGSCRQVMAEYEIADATRIKYILGGKSGVVQIFTGTENLLPFIFKLIFPRKEKRSKSS